MKISKHISYREATKSNTAIKYGIHNEPSQIQLLAMKELAEKVFEPLRIHFNVPIAVTSFYRSEELNKRIGGSSTSQHCKGEAMDLDGDVYNNISNAAIFGYIAENLEFDQLIWEFGDNVEPNWVHVSYKSGSNRKQILRAVKQGTKTKYISI